MSKNLMDISLSLPSLPLPKSLCVSLAGIATIYTRCHSSLLSPRRRCFQPHTNDVTNLLLRLCYHYCRRRERAYVCSTWRPSMRGTLMADLALCLGIHGHTQYFQRKNSSQQVYTHVWLGSKRVISCTSQHPQTIKLTEGQETKQFFLRLNRQVQKKKGKKTKHKILLGRETNLFLKIICPR